MRRALIACIHGNLVALEAVLKDIAAEAVDEIVCLGDIIGYGPDVVECVDLVREKCAWSLCGDIGWPRTTARSKQTAACSVAPNCESIRALKTKSGGKRSPPNPQSAFRNPKFSSLPPFIDQRRHQPRPAPFGATRRGRLIEGA